MTQETIQHIMDTLFTLETVKSKSHVHITQNQANQVLQLQRDHEALKERYEQLEKENANYKKQITELNSTLAFERRRLTKAGLTKEGK